MIAYLDTSVLMRIVLREPSPLAEWDSIDLGVTSELTFIECGRVLDRLRLLRVLDEDELAQKERDIADLMRRLDIVRLDRQVITQASQPLPSILGALDAIHLVSATLFQLGQPADERPILFATHDEALGRAARLSKFDVIGTGGNR